MKRKIQNSLIYSCGGALIGIGIVGVFLPVLQGLIFIALGLYIISLRSERVKRFLEKLLDKYPAMRRLGLRSSDYAKQFARKVGMFF